MIYDVLGGIFTSVYWRTGDHFFIMVDDNSITIWGIKPFDDVSSFKNVHEDQDVIELYNLIDMIYGSI